MSAAALLEQDAPLAVALTNLGEVSASEAPPAVDWTAVAPDPRLPAMNARCRCGAMRGEHLCAADDPRQRHPLWPCNGLQVQP